MKKRQSYRKQGLECDANGNRVKDDCIVCGRPILICKKYGKICRSKLCLKDRCK